MDLETLDLEDLAHVAVRALLERRAVRVAFKTRPAGWPLPIKREPGSAQNYRPLAVLEYVHECLNRQPESTDWSDLV